jgi:hypothetical protein
MARTATVHAVTAIGIDMGKNTLHMVGLDTRGTGHSGCRARQCLLDSFLLGPLECPHA